MSGWAVYGVEGAWGRWDARDVRSKIGDVQAPAGVTFVATHANTGDRLVLVPYAERGDADPEDIAAMLVGVRAPELGEVTDRIARRVTREQQAEERRRLHELRAAGHTDHCARRQLWGDGECECMPEGWHAPRPQRRLAIRCPVCPSSLCAHVVISHDEMRWHAWHTMGGVELHLDAWAFPADPIASAMHALDIVQSPGIHAWIDQVAGDARQTRPARENT